MAQFKHQIDADLKDIGGGGFQCVGKDAQSDLFPFNVGSVGCSEPELRRDDRVSYWTLKNSGHQFSIVSNCSVAPLAGLDVAVRFSFPSSRPFSDIVNSQRKLRRARLGNYPSRRSRPLTGARDTCAPRLGSFRTLERSVDLSKKTLEKTRSGDWCSQ